MRVKGGLAHDLGSGLFTLTKPGIYEVEYSANITSTTLGEASLDLELDGENHWMELEVIYTVATASALGNVDGSTLVQVPCGASYVISLGNNSALPLTVQDANIIIKKIA